MKPFNMQSIANLDQDNFILAMIEMTNLIGRHYLKKLNIKIEFINKSIYKIICKHAQNHIPVHRPQTPIYILFVKGSIHIYYNHFQILYFFKVIHWWIDSKHMIQRIRQITKCKVSAIL